MRDIVDLRSIASIHLYMPCPFRQSCTAFATNFVLSVGHPRLLGARKPKGLKRMSDGRLSQGGLVSRRHDATTSRASSSTEHMPLEKVIAAGSDAGVGHGMGKRGRSVWLTVARNIRHMSHTSSLLMALVTYLGIGVVASIVLVLYEYRSLKSNVSTGHGDGPICGRIANGTARPCIDSFTFRELDVGQLDEFTEVFIQGYRPFRVDRALNASVLHDFQKHMGNAAFVDFLGDTNVSVRMERDMDRTRKEELMRPETFVGNFTQRGWSLVYDLDYKDIQEKSIFSEFPIPGLFADVLRNKNGMKTRQFPRMDVQWTGPGSRSDTHSNGFMNFVFVVEGRMTVFVTDPSHQDDLYFPHFAKRANHSSNHVADTETAISPLKFYDPDLDRYPRYLEVEFSRFEMAAGDMLLLPKYMIHHIHTPEDVYAKSISFYVEDDLHDQHSLGVQSGCMGLVEVFGFLPRIIVQLTKDIYFMRPSYVSYVAYLLLPERIMPYEPVTAFAELFCRNGIMNVWSEPLDPDVETPMSDQSYVHMRDIFQDGYEERCIQTDADRTLAYIGACMFLSAAAVYVLREFPQASAKYLAYLRAWFPFVLSRHPSSKHTRIKI